MITIDKVVAVYLDPEEMETVNTCLGLDLFRSDTWTAYSDFQETPELYQYITTDILKALKHREIDYVVFRRDD